MYNKKERRGNCGVPPTFHVYPPTYLLRGYARRGSTASTTPTHQQRGDVVLRVVACGAIALLGWESILKSFFTTPS